MAKCLAERPLGKPDRWAEIFFVPQCSLHKGHDGPHKDEIMQTVWEESDV